jgi:hypothetical protein
MDFRVVHRGEYIMPHFGLETDNRMTQFWESCNRWGYECDCFYGDVRCGKTPNQFHHAFAKRDKRFRKWTDDVLNQQKVCHKCHVELRRTDTELNKKHFMALQCIRYGDAVWNWLEDAPSKKEYIVRPLKHLYHEISGSLILKVKEM